MVPIQTRKFLFFQPFVAIYQFLCEVVYQEFVYSSVQNCTTHYYWFYSIWVYYSNHHSTVTARMYPHIGTTMFHKHLLVLTVYNRTRPHSPVLFISLVEDHIPIGILDS